MRKYAANTIEEFLLDKTAPVVTSATDHLFRVRETEVRLREAEVRSFHRATTRLLFLFKRSRPDIS